MSAFDSRRVSAAVQTLTAPTRLLPHLQKLFPSSTNLSIRFTVSPSWLKKAGTVAFAISGPHHGSSSSNSSDSSSSSKGRITSRDGGGWRPSSLFGGWGSEKPVEPDISELVAKEEIVETARKAEGDEEEEEGGDTIKGEKGTSVVTSPPTLSLAARNGSTINRTRLSALFTDWIAPEATTPAATSPESKTRIVGGPRPMSMDLSKRFSSFTPGDRSSMLSLQESLGEEGEEEEEELGNVTEELESLMVSFPLIFSFV